MSQEVLMNFRGIAASERTTIIFLFAVLFSMLINRQHRKSTLLLALTIFFQLIELWADSSAFNSLVYGGRPLWYDYTVNTIAYSCGQLSLIPFSLYIKTVVEEIDKTKKWPFYFPIILTALGFIISVSAIAAGKVFAPVDGVMMETGGVPVATIIINLLVIIYISVVIFINRRIIGNKKAILLSLFGIIPAVIQIIRPNYSMLAGAVVLAFVYMILQNEIVIDEKKKVITQLEETAEKLNRTLAVSDYLINSFESAYYVNLNDNSFVTLRQKEFLQDDYSYQTDWIDVVTKYVDEGIVQEDRHLFDAVCNLRLLREQIEKEPEQIILFRDTSIGYERYCRLYILRGEDLNHAAVAFMDVDEETRKEEAQEIISAIAEEFEYVSAMDLDTEVITRYRASEKCRRIIDEIDTDLPSLERVTAFLKKIIHPDYWREFQAKTTVEAVKRELENKPEYQLDCLTLSPEGKEEWYRFKFAYLSGDRRKIVLGILDIDEQVRRDMENAVLQEKADRDAQMHEQMARIMELSDELQAIYDVDVETGEYEFFTYSENYVDTILVNMQTGRDFYADANRNTDVIIYPDDREIIRNRFANREYIRKTLAEQGGFDLEYRQVVNGEPVWHRVRIINKAGDRSRCLMGVFNIDSQVKAEKEHQKQLEEQMARIMGLSENFQAIYDVDFETGSYNLYTYENEFTDSVLVNMAQGDSFYTDAVKDADLVVHPDDRNLTRSSFSDKEYIRRRLDEEGEFTVDYRIIATGEPVWFRAKVTTKAGDDSRFLLGVFFVDERIRKEAEYKRKIEEALALAENANRAKTNFLNAMSHDIRTPMNAILGYTAIAKKNAMSAQVRESLDKIDISGQQLLNLINQILEMSRIESGTVELAENRSDLIERANAGLIVFGAEAERKGLKFTATVGELAHRYVITDDTRMSQIMTNIVGNAIKYTPEGGSISYYIDELPCDREGYGLYRFTVKDTGIGMAEEYLEHIFDEFSRERTSTVSQIQGTGLGMAIVKRLVDLMDGSIEVKSKLDEGTSIIITVPMKIDETQNEPEIEVQQGKAIDFSGKRILLVEDNEMNREIALDILEDDGFIVDTAEDGDIAVEMVRQNIEKLGGHECEYDAILMDIQMPRMNGFEATKAIRELPPSDMHIPIIAVSANAFEEDRQKSLASGMDDHVSKPIDVQKLKETLTKYL